MRESAVGSGCAGARLLRLRWCTAAPTRGWWDHSLDRYHSLRDRYHSLRDRNRSLRDRYHSLRDRSVLARDRSRDRSKVRKPLQTRTWDRWDRYFGYHPNNI